MPLDTMGPWSYMGPQRMSKKGPLETSGDHEAQIWKSLHSCSYGPQMGAPDQTFFVNFSIFFFHIMGPLPKNSGPNPKSFFGFGGGLPRGPLPLPPPPRQILATCLARGEQLAEFGKSAAQHQHLIHLGDVTAHHQGLNPGPIQRF